MATATRDLKQQKLPTPTPDIDRYSAEDASAFDLLPEIMALNVTGAEFWHYGGRGGDALLFGVIATKMRRSDVSNAAFIGVRRGPAMGSSDSSKSERQNKKWLPPIDLDLDLNNRVLYWTDPDDIVRG
jgi:hypothetical protein